MNARSSSTEVALAVRPCRGRSFALCDPGVSSRIMIYNQQKLTRVEDNETGAEKETHEEEEEPASSKDNNP